MFLKKKERKKLFVFVPFLFSSLPKVPLPVVRLFDVKDDWTAFFPVFSCDITKAFEFTLVLSFLSRQKKKRKNGAEKTKLNHGQSPFCPFGVCLKKQNNKKNNLSWTAGKHLAVPLFMEKQTLRAESLT